VFVREKLLDDERQFVAELRALHSTYAQPAAERQLLPAVDHGTVFFNVTAMADAHDQFAAALEAAVGGDGEVGAAISQHLLPARALHESYCLNLSQMTIVLARAMATAPFATFVQQASSAPTARQRPLQQLLLRPLARLFSYPSVLVQLRELDERHADAPVLGAAVDALHQIATLGAKCRTEAAATQRVIELAMSTRAVTATASAALQSLPREGRVLLRSANVMLAVDAAAAASGTVRGGGMATARRPAALHLLNDMLFWRTAEQSPQQQQQRRQSYTYAGHVDLLEAEFGDMFDEAAGDSSKGLHGVRVRRTSSTGGAPTPLACFYFGEHDEKSDWLRALLIAKSELPMPAK